MIGPTVFMFLAVAPAAAQGDPLAPAMAGQVECYVPNLQRRVCRSIDAYSRQSNGVVHTPRLC